VLTLAVNKASHLCHFYGTLGMENLEKNVLLDNCGSLLCIANPGCHGRVSVADVISHPGVV
jgi:hypothetical protein